MAIGREFSSEIATNSLLSRDAILAHLEMGNIVIDPFKAENLGTVSYDVTLGSWYFKEQRNILGRSFYSPWSEEDVREVWGEPQCAESAGELFMEARSPIPEGISSDDRVIVIGPQETVLCHTNEFIGGRNTVTTMMKARSSLGRNFIEICKCAGWGDVGYISRWTMEVTNNSQHYAIPLVVGRRIAQIAFFQVDKFSGGSYTQDGKYQQTEELGKIKSAWRPDQMLPKMWKDREVLK